MTKRMTKPKILVTGATGKTGSAVVRRLLELQMPVRALVRRHDARSRALQAAGAQIVVADLFDPDGLRQALDGVQRAYYVPPFKPYMTQSAAAFAAAAEDARVEAIVQLSQWLSHRAHPSILTRETWLVDRLFATLPGVAHVIVNPGMFADNFLRVIDFASLLHVYPVLTGDSRSAPVANEDIARVVVALLLDPDRHAGRSVRPTGPALLSGRDMAGIIGQVLGQRVWPVDLPFWLFLKAARATGAPIHEVYNYREYLRDHRRGAFSLGHGVTDDVLRLTGRPAEGFDVTARRYAALPFAQRTVTNRLKALLRFMLLPALPGHDLAAYARRMSFPSVAEPSLAADDTRWLADHVLDELNAPQAHAPRATPSAEVQHAPA